MKTSLPFAVSPAASFRVSAAAAAALLSSLLGSTPLPAASAGSTLLGVEIYPANVKPEAPGEEEAAKPEPDLSSPLKFAYFCFGPVFGNDSRSIDPNYMPPPTATDESSVRADAPVRYMRVPTIMPDRTTWVGYDGSQISYRSRAEASAAATPLFAKRDSVNPGAAVVRAEANPTANAQTASNSHKEPSVAELIAENRKEMTRISWERTYRRFPELEREDSAERVAFEAYLFAKHANPREAASFDSPMWPEAAAAAFMAERNWKKAEEESWERVRSKVRIFNDPESAYTRRFMEFASGLRSDPEEAGIFREPTWPERALELHDEKLGAVPEQFR